MTMQKSLTSRSMDIVCIGLLICATIVLNLVMMRDGLNGQADMPTHVTWLQHFSKQFAEGIWYPRWLAGTNYGYGSPTFVFYPPLVYYLGSLFKLSGLSTENTVVILFSLALFLSGFNFYLFGRARCGIIPSLLGALAYMTAPYLALDVYWRGGLASIFVQAWIPLIWWVTEQSLKKTQWRTALALSWTILALTHTTSLLLCAIVWLPYTLFFLLNYAWKNVVAAIVFAGIGLGIASLYLLPAIVEQSFVNTEIMKGVLGGFKAAMLGAGLSFFPTNINELVSIPYIVTHQTLAILIVAGIILIWCRSQAEVRQEAWRWGLMSVAVLFMMTSLSMPIWEASNTLQMVQFPWRFLQIFSFTGAALFAVAVKGILEIRFNFKLVLYCFVIAILLANFRYWYKLSRQFVTIGNPGRGNIEHLAYFKEILYAPYQNNLRDVEEYRPLLNDGRALPPTPVIGQPKISVTDGQAKIRLNQWESYQRRFDVTVQESSTIRIRTYYYPAWHLYVNNQPSPINMSEDGTIELNLEEGIYSVELLHQWTPAFKIGIVLSIFSLLLLFFVPYLLRSIDKYHLYT
ncbi:MAG: hypothetical protein ACFB4I_07055 [Cyanophyceae cyanobacterium]